jgi:hypothetical protein
MFGLESSAPPKVKLSKPTDDDNWDDVRPIIVARLNTSYQYDQDIDPIVKKLPYQRHRPTGQNINDGGRSAARDHGDPPARDRGPGPKILRSTPQPGKTAPEQQQTQPVTVDQSTVVKSQGEDLKGWKEAIDK